MFPPVSVCFRATLPGNYAAHYRDPVQTGVAIPIHCCSSCTAGCQRLRRREGGDLWVELLATLRHAQRAQGMKKINISVPAWSFQATNLRLQFSIENETLKRATQLANFLGRLMSESRVGNRDLKFNAAPDCFQPPKTGCRPHLLRLPLWTTPLTHKSHCFLQVIFLVFAFFYLVRPFWHFSLERSFIVLTFDLISLSWVSPFVWSSMFLPSSFTTLLVFQRLCGVWISLQPLPASTSATSAATANAAHHFAFYNYCDC